MAHNDYENCLYLLRSKPFLNSLGVSNTVGSKDMVAVRGKEAMVTLRFKSTLIIMSINLQGMDFSSFERPNIC